MTEKERASYEAEKTRASQKRLAAAIGVPAGKEARHG